MPFLETRCEVNLHYHHGEDLQQALQEGWCLSRLSRIVHRFRGKLFTVYLVELAKEGRILNLQIVDTPYLQCFAQKYCDLPVGFLNLEAYHSEDAIFDTFYNSHPYT